MIGSIPTAERHPIQMGCPRGLRSLRPASEKGPGQGENIVRQPFRDRSRPNPLRVHRITIRKVSLVALANFLPDSRAQALTTLMAQWRADCGCLSMTDCGLGHWSEPANFVSLKPLRNATMVRTGACMHF
jgi:hypothetical protein